jgi:hypothetical protein
MRTVSYHCSQTWVSWFPVAGSWCKTSSFLWRRLPSARYLPFTQILFCFCQGGLSNVIVIQISTFWTTALRSVEKYLGLEKLYVLGTNCGNNWWISKSVDLDFFCCMEDILELFSYTTKHSQWTMVLVKDLINFWRLQVLNQKLSYITNLCKTTRWYIIWNSRYPLPPERVSYMSHE